MKCGLVWFFVMTGLAVVSGLHAASAASYSGSDGFSGIWDTLTGQGDPDVSTFLGDSANNGDGDSNGDGDIGSPAWGLHAGVSRGFTSAATQGHTLVGGDLGIGESMSITMDTGFIESLTNSQVGVELDASGFARFQFRFKGGESNYEFGTPGSFTDSGIGFTDEGLRIDFTLTGVDSYDLSVTRLEDDMTFSFPNQSLGGPAGSGISRVEIFAVDSGEGSSNDAFFNDLVIVPEPSTACLLICSLGLLSRRQRT